MAYIRYYASNLMNEPPPFATSSVTSSIRSRTQEPAYEDPRPSNESEERPFEHWYRGDVRRNGGVGELRVAKHMEMLQIANYGHNLRKTTRRPPSRDPYDHVDSSRRRKRADSSGAGTHESLYLDDERTKGIGMVFDESPLTDIEVDPDTDIETFYDAYAGVNADDTIHSGFSASMPGLPLPAVASSPPQTPTNAHPAPETSPPPTQPSHAQAISDPLRSSAPSALPRTSVESTMPTPPHARSRTRTVSRATSPTSQSSDQSQTKRRAKSPAAASPASTPKKAKTKAKTPPPASRKDDPRNSVAVYPTPEGNVVDAIPTWTQPVQTSGNWDEVVLPVVARKKGLDGQYEKADGSPRPKPPEQTPIKPAPGTFGYDYTKYRPARVDEEIPMDEFGRLPEDPPPLKDEEVERRQDETPPESIPLSTEPEEPIRPAPRKTVPLVPDSPAPFSRYRVEQIPTINITRPSTDIVEQLPEADDETVVGECCKCVVM